MISDFRNLLDIVPELNDRRYYREIGANLGSNLSIICKIIQDAGSESSVARTVRSMFGLGLGFKFKPGFIIIIIIIIMCVCVCLWLVFS